MDYRDWAYTTNTHSLPITNVVVAYREIYVVHHTYKNGITRMHDAIKLHI